MSSYIQIKGDDKAVKFTSDNYAELEQSGFPLMYLVHASDKVFGSHKLQYGIELMFEDANGCSLSVKSIWSPDDRVLSPAESFALHAELTALGFSKFDYICKGKMPQTYDITGYTDDLAECADKNDCKVILMVSGDKKDKTIVICIIHNDLVVASVDLFNKQVDSVTDSFTVSAELKDAVLKAAGDKLKEEGV